MISHDKFDFCYYAFKGKKIPNSSLGTISVEDTEAERNSLFPIVLSFGVVAFVLLLSWKLIKRR